MLEDKIKKIIKRKKIKRKKKKVSKNSLFI
jgi:hypothetical protein